MAKLAKRPREARRGAWTAGDIERLLRRYHEIGEKILEEKASGITTSSSKDRPEHLKIRLRECRRFAQAYSTRELEALMTMQTQQGTPLPWSVVRQLMAVTDKKKREQLQERAAEENWSAIRTAAIIQSKVFRKKRSAGGRPCAPPEDLEELLQQVERHLGESMRRHDLWIGFLQQLKNNPPGKRNRLRLRSRILQISDSLKTVLMRSKELAKLLEFIAEDDSKADE